MKIDTFVDENQSDDKNRDGMAICPVCGQKLFRVYSIFHRGVFRNKCRRCRKYINVYVTD